MKSMQVTLQELLAGKDANGAWFGIPEARLRLKLALNAVGYDPTTGFGLDEEVSEDLPPVMPDSLRDLGSHERLTLTLKTQEDLLRNAARRSRELEPDRLAQFPAWQLVRIESREVPRGMKKSKGVLKPDPENAWPRRWVKAGGHANHAAALMAWIVSCTS